MFHLAPFFSQFFKATSAQNAPVCGMESKSCNPLGFNKDKDTRIG
jgi:hypothetical protein